MPRFESYAQGTPCYIELYAGDLPAATRFYADLFGWTYDAPPSHQEVYASARVQGDRVGGLSAMPPERAGEPSVWELYLAVDDVDAATAKVEPAGGTVALAPTDVMTLGRMSTVVDPTGARVSLWQAGDIIGTERANEPGTPCWSELLTSDLDAAAAFYADVLGVGWDQQSFGSEPYWLLQAGGRPVAGAMRPSQPMPSQWMAYLNVEDVDATLARAEELGAKQVIPPFDVEGIGRIGVLADPQGAMFAVMKDAT